MSELGANSLDDFIEKMRPKKQVKCELGEHLADPDVIVELKSSCVSCYAVMKRAVDEHRAKIEGIPDRLIHDKVHIIP